MLEYGVGGPFVKENLAAVQWRKTPPTEMLMGGDQPLGRAVRSGQR